MNSIIVYCSKTGNTDKVARAMWRGLGPEARLLKLDLSCEGIMEHFSAEFVFDLAPYDLIFLGGWTMVMQVHPFLSAYIKQCGSIEGKKIVGFLTGAAIFSRGAARNDFVRLIAARGACLYDFYYVTTMLGATLTGRKLSAAEQFASGVARRFVEGR